MKLSPDQRYLAGRSIGAKPSKPKKVGLWVGPVNYTPPTPHREQIELKYAERSALAALALHRAEHKVVRRHEPRELRSAASAAWVARANHEAEYGVMPG